MDVDDEATVHPEGNATLTTRLEAVWPLGVVVVAAAGTVDAGEMLVTGTTVDAGEMLVTGTTVDAGEMLVTGTTVDAGEMLVTGTTVDAGEMLVTGTTVDAGEMLVTGTTVVAGEIVVVVTPGLPVVTVREVVVVGRARVGLWWISWGTAIPTATATTRAAVITPKSTSGLSRLCGGLGG